MTIVRALGDQRKHGMDSLKETLLDAAKRDGVIDDCLTLIDQEVAGKGGLTGLAVKGAYAVVKKIKPGFVREVVVGLLPDFVARLEPYYRDWRKDGGDIERVFSARSSE